MTLGWISAIIYRANSLSPETERRALESVVPQLAVDVTHSQLLLEPLLIPSSSARCPALVLDTAQSVAPIRE